MREFIQKLFKDSYFRRMFCGLSNSCGGGSGGGAVSSVNGGTGDVVLNLQDITDEENITSNALLIRGVGKIDVSTDGLVLGYAGGNTILFNVSDSGNSVNSITMGPANWAIGSGQDLTLYANSSNPSPFSFQGAGDVLQRVRGAQAVNPDEFVTLAQVQALINA